MRKILIFLFIPIFILMLVLPVFAGETKIGGHVKMTVYDGAVGVRGTGPSGTVVNNYKGWYYGGITVNELILYVSQELTDNISIEVSPKFSASTGATPSLYSSTTTTASIASNKATSVTPKFEYLEKAYIKAVLPFGIEASLGMLTPAFTMEYGHELFWEEVITGGKFIANPSLSAIHDAGLELYYNVGIGDDISMPVYFYLLNGNSYVDRNSQPWGMIHIEPQWGMFTLSGSYGNGRMEDNATKNYHRWSAGGKFKWEWLEIRGEFVKGKWERAKTSGSPSAADYGQDAIVEGAYVKALIRPLKEVRFIYSYDYSLSNYNSIYAYVPGGGERYVTNTGAVNFFMTDSAILIGQVDVANYRKSSGSEVVVYTRTTLGTRITF